MDVTGMIAMFTAILVASGVFLYFGTIGLKGRSKNEEEEDQLQR